jgi:hypothetical protein
MIQIITPGYNEWLSLTKLLFLLNKSLKIKKKINILIVDDFSSEKTNLLNLRKKFKNINSIKILRLRENVGSQKAIYFGLKFLNNKKKDFYLVVMDSDGEDNPIHIKKMLNVCEREKNLVVVSCRKDRKEYFWIKLLYKFHLILTLFFTGEWITFGNFSAFHSSNLKKILSNNSISIAYSAGILKNTKIIRTYSARLKRYYGKSKVSLFFLFKHSFKIMGVFYKRVLLFSLIYCLLLQNFMGPKINFLIILFICINFLIVVNTFDIFHQEKKIINKIYKIK